MQQLVDQLRNVPFQRLVDSQSGWTDLPVPRGFTSMDWVPCVEAVGSPEVRFLTDTPRALMQRGQFLQVPSIMGYVDVSCFFKGNHTL